MAARPDEGFAWVIALACFFINFIMAGLARTAGVLYVAIIDLYGVSREAATTPFSLRVCVRNMTGPVIGLLGQKYGIRILSTVGSFIAALGSIFCYFAPNVLWITIFWGFIHGLGFGLCTVLHMMTINQYFDKYKASALGLGYSGDCFGSFAFPILMEHLFAAYGVRGSFLIIGGIVLNTIPLALLLRKPPWLKNAAKPKKSKTSFKKISDHFKKEEITNYQRCEMNNRFVKSRSQVGMLSTVNEIESSEREKNEDTKLHENAPNPKQFSTFGYDLKGQVNKAFTSSESNLSSLNCGNMVKSSLNHQNSFANLEKRNLLAPPRNNLAASTSGAFPCCDVHSSTSSLCESKCWKKSDDLRVCSEIKTSRSVTDLKANNQEFPHHINRSLRLNKAHHLNLVDRRDSMPSVLKKETRAKEKLESSIPEDGVKNENTYEAESTRVDENMMLRKRRTSSFVEVAHDFVNRMRTASFASSVAQDAFFTPIPQEPESDSEEEFECELKSVVEHRNHDIDNCTHHDLVLTVDRAMMEDYFKEIPEEPEKVVEKKKKPPSVFKIMLRTNMKPMFILISVSMAVYAFLFCSVATIIIDYASDLGVPQEKGKYLLIGFSVTDLIGRLSFGQIIDRKMMKIKNYSGATMLLMGALVAVIPLNVSFNYMMVCMCMYGLVQGGTAIMFPILINTYMDRNSESVAMGCVNFYGGLLMLLMAPMIGFFRDNTGSYNYVFYIIGGTVAVVGIVWQFEPMIVKFQNRKLREKYIMRELSVASFQQ